MDKDTRNRIQRATQAARRLLEEELREQLEGTYDILESGEVAAEAGAHLREEPEALRVRAKLVAAVQHHRDLGLKPREAVAALQRECAFTTLNRFVALKMLEARGIVQDCVSRGPESSGFKEFCGLAPGLAALPDQGYRLYLDSVFDEIGREVRVLFDRRDPASLLWPRKTALDALLAELNDPELAEVWGEDETIGWVYQYFNGDDERKQMRAESQAPRNSRELAVRNQFFTPRYVVEFLTDNTLARTWVEMRRGQTRLVDQCRYLVKRKDEVFLGVGEETPPVDEAVPLEDRTVYVPFRAKKDPRDLKILDPACGSGHFLLYAFELLLAVYEEAWADLESPASEVTGRSLREDFASLEELRRELPGLILRHNLYGVDIDPRAAQIAALALWMRAQRAWKDYGLRRAIRPLVTRTNIVVAEPMPGEADLLDELCAGLDKGVAGIVRAVFEDMKLAGEAGTLLRIEETVQQGLEKLVTGGALFAEEDARRWERVEAQVYEALRGYAEAAGGVGYRRRLFAEDAARGFAFIEVCRRQYDAVLMNPPFGAAAKRALDRIRIDYAIGYVDLYCSFVDRGLELLKKKGFLGAITSRTGLFLSSYRHWRRQSLLGDHTVRYLADLGIGVLDAMVETAAYVISAPADDAVFLDCRSLSDSGIALGNEVWEQRKETFYVPIADFKALPDHSLAYWAGSLLKEFSASRPLTHIAPVNKGGATGDDERFVRLAWEVPENRTRWRWLSKGGAYAPFYLPIHLRVDWMRDGDYLGESLYLQRPREGLRWGSHSNTSTFQGKPGIFWSLRSQKGLSVRVLPADCLVTHKSPFAAMDGLPTRERMALLGYLNSTKAQRLAECVTAFGSYEIGAVGSLPYELDEQTTARLAEAASVGVRAARVICSALETDPWYSGVLSTTTLGASPDDCILQIRSDLQSALADLHESVAEVDSILKVNDGASAPERLSFFSDLCDSIGVPTLLSNLVGIAIGRWSDPASSAKNQRSVELEDPWEPLPQLQPGVRDASIEVILVDDPGHPRDICTAVMAGVAYCWGAHGDSHLARSLSQSHGVSLRDWLGRSFFSAHCDSYSQSRRKAPIYWQLGSPSASYSVWIYIHRMGPDTLHAVLRDHVEPKLRFETNRLAALRSDAGDSPAPSQRKVIDAQESFVDELRSFRDELQRVAPLWSPDLDDGVVINASFLHRLFLHTRSWAKECESHWEKLQAGDYDWAHLALRLWPERVVPKCTEDRSLAIAHGLEETLWVEGEDGKWRPRDVDEATVEALVRERTSPAVKDALRQLSSAPPPAKASKQSKGARPKLAKEPRPAKPPPPRAAQLPLDLSTPTTGPDAAALDALRAALREHPDGAGKAELLVASGLDEAQWKPAIDALVDSGEALRTGQKRGTRYQLPRRP